MNASLITPFTAAEVETALNTMSPDKSSSSDGMSTMFYQNYWDIVGNSVTEVVLSVLNHNQDMEQINQAIITLAPKISSPHVMVDFRPISLCNVIYKLIFKMIVLRFKEALPLVISKTQSAFLSNRLITDNILVAFELVHNIHHRKRGAKYFLALKLDMSKAFDRVKWTFFMAVMAKMGFAKEWIELIYCCLSSCSLTFSINGDIMGHVKLIRGLRQGDPLSPYLFLICSEGLSRLLQHEEASNNLQGLRITRNAPSISHLLFADDSLLFCEATKSSALAIRRALSIYHNASGQLLNYQKSVMSFSPNTPIPAQQFFQQTLNMPISECHEQYLGLHSYPGRDKKALFSHIKERVWKLMNAWNEKLFSVGGKESMMANFWWGTSKDGSKIHWKRWNLLCKSKFEGGMGFRSFIHYNQALLAKQAWRIFDMPTSFLNRLLKSRYFSNNNFLEARLGNTPSLTWQSIHWGRELLLKGLRYKVGNGYHIRCGLDKWIPGHTEFTPIHYTGQPTMTVSSLITDSREWNIELLNEHFGPLDVERILSIPLSFFPTNDRLVWHHTTSGIYNVKLGFYLSATLDERDQSTPSDLHSSWWKTFWHLSLPSKIKIFAWKVMHNAISTAAALHKRKVIDSATCSMCNCIWESIGHTLFSCKHAKSVWTNTAFCLDFRQAQQMFNGDYLFHLSMLHSQQDFELMICTMWAIWTSRNKALHGSSVLDGKHTATFAKEYLEKIKVHTNRQQKNAGKASSTHTAAIYSSNVPAPAAATFCSNVSAPTAATSCRSSSRDKVTWHPPPSSGIKINVDAAVNSVSKQLGVGAIVRNHNGQVLAALSMPI
uniref:Reverse transcriptase domain-containing protein n=1 Tax=Cannabis sativa TaxID=3483 RepID=A0A803NHT6_CANSA